MACRVCSVIELDRSARLPLPDRRALDWVAVGWNILDFDGYDITAAEFAIDRQIEHGKVSSATFDH
jgi:hypothetical protein